MASDRLFLRSGGWQSNIVYLSTSSDEAGPVSIPAGKNVANVSGAIEGLYPSTDPSFPQAPCIGFTPVPVPCGFESFSQMLHAGKYSLSFDLDPSAAPFDVAAVGDSSSALIS